MKIGRRRISTMKNTIKEVVRKVLLLTLLISLTFAQGNRKLNFLSGHKRHGHHHRHHHGCGHGNHYNYKHKYWPNHRIHHLFNHVIWLSYYNNLYQRDTDEKKTDAQILKDIEKLYVLYEQDAITEAEYNALKEVMLKELENN